MHKRLIKSSHVYCFLSTVTEASIPPRGRSCSLKITAHMCELSNWFQELSPVDTGKLAFQLEKGALLKWAIIFTDRLTLFLVEFWVCFHMIQFHRAIDPNTTVNRMLKNCYFCGKIRSFREQRTQDREVTCQEQSFVNHLYRVVSGSADVIRVINPH